MKRLLLAVAVIALGPSAAAPASAAPASRPLVLAINVQSEINPVSAIFVKDSIGRAESRHAAALVILLDTPGGLSTSMQDIYEAELASSVPVIVYVSPNGARAASAGVFVTMAADVAAMAPATNIGSATPIDSSGGNIGSDLRAKVLNDAEKKIQALAETHGRNARAAVLTVAKAANYTASEALKNKLVDYVSPSLPTLLNTIDGTTVRGGKGIVLHTANAQIETDSMPFTLVLLNILIDPNLLFLLFLAGIGGIGYEVFHPGVILPGTLGAVCLILALFGFSVVPVNYAGIALIIFGVALLITEAYVTSHGLIALSGIVSLAAGGLLLFRTPGNEMGVSPWVILTISALFGGALATIATKVVAARHQPPSAHGAGAQGLVGEVAVVRAPLEPRGQVFVHGELWQAELDGGGVDAGGRADIGDRVVVRRVDGLTLHVIREEILTTEGA